MKTCKKCNTEKDFTEFDKNSRTSSGYSAHCKSCKKENYLNRKNKDPLHIYLIAKKSECKQKGFDFDLDIEFLKSIWTDVCPIFGTPMKLGTGVRGDGYNSHLDRIDPELGYVKSNVAWISGRANRIKYNATAEDLRAIANWMERATTRSKDRTLK